MGEVAKDYEGAKMSVLDVVEGGGSRPTSVSGCGTGKGVLRYGDSKLSSDGRHLVIGALCQGLVGAGISMLDPVAGT